MQFVKGGPDVPERLLQAHEDGKVVFFCGAGVSYPAELPTFSGLVKRIYSSIGVTTDPVEASALKSQAYDTVLGLLEGRLNDGRSVVRRAASAVLTPNLALPNALRTHEALMTLSECRDGHLRLITTNFDRLFEEVISRRGNPIETYRAPLLPVPKSRWNGLVYLHGLLPETVNQSELNRLVLTSGDFGLAYLVERWAARFVSELFRNYTICFVGYSINDPVMRYMMDALAADRLMGEAPVESFAFGSVKGNKEQIALREWKAKNVTPILYKETPGHRLLHETLEQWAATYRDGVRGKQAVVAKYAGIAPVRSTRQDDFIRRMIWALSDGTGLPAKHFAEFDPCPPLSWLEHFTEPLLGHRDLVRFGVTPNAKVDDDLHFSFLSRPAPYTHSPLMSLVSDGVTKNGRLDDVMFQMARWLARHLTDPKLLFWIVKNGSNLHPRFRDCLTYALKELAPTVEGPVYKLWRLYLAGCVRQGNETVDLYDWYNEFKEKGGTFPVRLRWREALKPYVKLSEPYLLGRSSSTQSSSAAKISDVANCEVVLGAEYLEAAFATIREAVESSALLPELFADLNGLLRDTMSLRYEIEAIDEEHDYSYILRPSIGDHPQNYNFDDWTALIVIVRDAWMALADTNRSSAAAEFELWLSGKFPIFKRLALFAATARPDVASPSRVVEFLCNDGVRWLWSSETRRETMMFLKANGRLVEVEERLQAVILAGPLRGMFRDDIDDVRWQKISEEETWLVLKTLSESGVVLGDLANSRVADIERRFPELRLDAEDIAGFPVYTRLGQSPSNGAGEAPEEPGVFGDWLNLEEEEENFDRERTWREFCARNLDRASSELIDRARQNIWPRKGWEAALKAWSDDALAPISWLRVAPEIVAMPSADFHAIVGAVSWWLSSISKAIEPDQGLFFRLVARTLDAVAQDSVERADDIHFRAINHPAGLATRALLDYWYKSGLEDGQLLQGDYRGIFSELCQRKSQTMHYGRLILAQSVIALFRVDGEWTKEFLLPYFDWKSSPMAALSMWESFLYSPRLYWPLLDCLKSSIVATSHRLNELSAAHQRQFVGLLTYAALESIQGEPKHVHILKACFESLPTDAFAFVASSLERSLRGAGDQRPEYFANRVEPFMKAFWRKSRDAKTKTISAELARACVAAGPAFPQAVDAFTIWLQPLERADMTVFALEQANLAAQFPAAVLKFLDLIIDTETRAIPNKLGVCLKTIFVSDPTLVSDRRFDKLSLLAQKNGVDWRDLS